MTNRRSRFVRAIVAALLVLAPAGIVIAQSPADFYKSRNVDLYIGYSVGGAYDFYARVIGRHMGAHIPGNPTLVPRNMEGAGSLRLANWLYRVAPQDGSAFGTIGRGIAFDPLLIGKGDQFDADKFNWLGSANNEVSVCVALKDPASPSSRTCSPRNSPSAAPAPAPTPISSRACSTTCWARTSRSSRAIPAATTWCWPWSAARSAAAAAGRGRA